MSAAIAWLLVLSSGLQNSIIDFPSKLQKLVEVEDQVLERLMRLLQGFDVIVVYHYRLEVGDLG